MDKTWSDPLIRVTYDREIDTLYVTIGKPEPGFYHPLDKPDLLLRLSADGAKVLGIAIEHFVERARAGESTFVAPIQADFTIDRLLQKEIKEALARP